MATYIIRTNWCPLNLIELSKLSTQRSLWNSISNDEAITGSSRRWSDLQEITFGVIQYSEDDNSFMEIDNPTNTDSPSADMSEYVKQFGNAILDNVTANSFIKLEPDGSPSELASEAWVARQIVYDSEEAEGSLTSYSVGGIKKSTRLSELNGNTFSKIIDKMLFGELPLIIMNWQSSSIATNINPLILPNSISEIELTATFNQGNYDNNEDGVSDGNLAGSALRFKVLDSTVETTYLNNIAKVTIDNLDFQTIARYTISGETAYATGPIVYNNKQQPVSNIQGRPNPIPAGNIVASVNYEIVVPFYATSVTSEVSTEQTLISLYSDHIDISLVEHLGGAKQFFELPIVANIKGASTIMQYNIIANEYQKVDIAEYTATDIGNAHNFGVNYVRYTYRDSRGFTKLKIYF